MSRGPRVRRTRSLSDPAISSPWRTRVLSPSPRVIAGAVVLFAADQYVYQQAGSAVLPQAPLDWTDHLLTTLFIVWAVKPRVSERQLVPALVASVVIDVDHVPGELGSHILTTGTSRPYSHSLTTVAVLLVLAAARRDWRAWASGAALGVASHLWRDLAEPQGSGVALFWPVSDRTITTPAAVYLGSIAVLAAIGLARSWDAPDG
jgi:inner membrane protein